MRHLRERRPNPARSGTAHKSSLHSRKYVNPARTASTSFAPIWNDDHALVGWVPLGDVVTEIVNGLSRTKEEIA